MLCFNQDATAQTHLTGDRLILLDDVQWKWGEIPETTPHSHSVHRMSSRLSQTPVAVSGTLTNRLADTGAAAVARASRPFAAATVERSPEKVVTANTLESVDCECEKGLVEAKALAETNSVQTTLSAACSSDTIDSQITEPLPEMKKGQLAGFMFPRIVLVYYNKFGWHFVVIV